MYSAAQGTQTMSIRSAPPDFVAGPDVRTRFRVGSAALLPYVCSIGLLFAQGVQRNHFTRINASIKVILEDTAGLWVTQLTNGAFFDLAHTFARDFELFAHFLQRVVVIVQEAETKLDHLAFAYRQLIENLGISSRSRRWSVSSTGPRSRVSSMISPSVFSSSSESGASSEKTFSAQINNSLTRSAAMFNRSPIMSEVGSRPSSWYNWRVIRFTRITSSMM